MQAMQNVAAALDNAAASADENDMISADSIAGLSDALYSSVTDLEGVDGSFATQYSSEISNAVSSMSSELSSRVSELNSAAEQMNAVAGQLSDGASTLSNGAQNMSAGADQMNAGAGQIPDVSGNAFSSVTAAVKQLYAGAQAVNAGTQSVSSALTTLENSTASFPQAAAGVKALNDGFKTLTSNDTTLTDGAASLKSAGKKLTAAVPQISSGASQLSEGASTLNDGIKEYTDGVSTLASNNEALTSGTGQLADGAKTLASGADTLSNGTKTLASGTAKLVANNDSLTSGARKLADGASQIQSGSSQLYDGSKELGDGMTKLKDGSSTLSSSLSEGADQVKSTKSSDTTVSMFATPIEDEEIQITTVENNGHAMAPYMMSVGLWVGALAFCLMYPLTTYKGKLKSGFAWWASKASILYPVAILQGLLLIILLHVFNGFTPIEMTKTVLFACLTAMAFTSIMYFFNITFGKVGSFLMLVFMVIQLAGSAGTYPVEISPEFVSKIHAYVPFTYTVNAFRSTIAGGTSIRQSVYVLIGLIVVFTLLTILQFNHMAHQRKANRKTLYDWLEEKGLA